MVGGLSCAWPGDKDQFSTNSSLSSLYATDTVNHRYTNFSYVEKLSFYLVVIIILLWFEIMALFARISKILGYAILLVLTENFFALSSFTLLSNSFQFQRLIFLIA